MYHNIYYNLLNLNQNKDEGSEQQTGGIRRLSADRAPLVVLKATEQEHAAHEQRLDLVAKGGECLWRAE